MCVRMCACHCIHTNVIEHIVGFSFLLVPLCQKLRSPLDAHQVSVSKALSLKQLKIEPEGGKEKQL